MILRYLKHPLPNSNNHHTNATKTKQATEHFFLVSLFFSSFQRKANSVPFQHFQKGVCKSGKNWLKYLNSLNCFQLRGSYLLSVVYPCSLRKRDLQLNFTVKQNRSSSSVFFFLFWGGAKKRFFLFEETWYNMISCRRRLVLLRLFHYLIFLPLWPLTNNDEALNTR